MGGHPFALVEDFDGFLGRPDGHFLAAQRVGDTVVMLVVLDVVIDVDTGRLPDCKLVGRFRQR